MGVTLIYADTGVWNALCEQSVDPGKLTSDLGTQRAQLVLGTNAVYEMAKTFKGSRPSARQRGQALFSCLRQYVERGVPLLRQTDDLLREEAKACSERDQDLNLFYGSSDYEKLKAEVDKLAQGVFDSRAARFIPQREAEAKQSRNALYAALEDRPQLKRKLAAIPEESVGRWISREVKHSARRILTGHLTHVISGQPLRDYLAC